MKEKEETKVINVAVSTSLSKSTTVEDMDIGLSLTKYYVYSEFTPFELMGVLEDWAREKLETVPEDSEEAYFIGQIIHSCQGWTEDELEVIKEL